MLVSCPVANRPEGKPRLWGKLKIRVSPGSLAFRIYKKSGVEEAFNCNYELNPDFRGRLEASGLRVSGVGEDGGIRIVELPDRRFFIATAFQPQLMSEAAHPHPMIVAFLEVGRGIWGKHKEGIGIHNENG